MEQQTDADLETACSAGQYDQVVALLSDNRILPPSSLHAAARNGHARIGALLLGKGAKIDRETVWAALASKSIPVFQALLDAGWDPNWRLSHAGSAITRAVIEDDVALVDFLLKHGSDPTEAECDQTHSMLATAAIFWSTGVVGRLLAHGLPVKQSGALEAASYYGKVEMIGYLLDHGSDIDEITDNDWTSASEREAGLGSALHTAAVRGQKEAVQLLLERGADRAMKDTKGKTAMQKARENGHSEIVELLGKQRVEE